MYARERKSEFIPRLMKVPELCGYLSMGRTSALKFAREAGAERAIGRTKVYDREIIDKAIDRMNA